MTAVVREALPNRSWFLITHRTGAIAILRRPAPHGTDMRRAPKPPRAVLWGKLAWHPAAKAWMEFAEDATEPETIEVVRDDKRSASGGESIIAQRAPAARAALARTWHQHILARLPGSTWRYCGCRREAVG